MLKLLEEPPPGAVFVLTTVDARRVLPTIRSRAGADPAAPAGRRRGARLPERSSTEPRWS